MAALALHGQQAGLNQQRQVPAGRRGTDVACGRQLMRRERAPIHQRQQHGGAGGLADKGRDVRSLVDVHGGDGTCI